MRDLSNAEEHAGNSDKKAPGYPKRHIKRKGGKLAALEWLNGKILYFDTQTLRLQFIDHPFVCLGRRGGERKTRQTMGG